jgi:amidophosphoribosyltransferase
MYPCIYAFYAGTSSELAYRMAISSFDVRDMENPEEYPDQSGPKHAQMIDWIYNDLNVTSLKYIEIDDMIAVIRIPKDQLRLDCWQCK